MEYVVTCAHQGDKWYNKGDTRTAREQDVQHLVDFGVLKPKEVENKKEDGAPENKAVAPKKNKAKAPKKNKAKAG